MIAGFLWATAQEEKEQCYDVRKKVFLDEQGFSNEYDEIDGRAHHLLFLDDDKSVAAARLYLEDGEWHVGRVCTLKEYRGMGIGKFLMRECMNKAAELGKSDILSISAQLQAEPFYEKLGFVREGEEYLDEHCPHVRMKIRVSEQLAGRKV